MIRFGLKRKLGGNQIPGHLTTLSVSWLNNQFKAVAIHRGTVVGTYEHPAEVDGSANFQSLLREAVSQTGYSGQTVSLLLAHPRLVQQLVDVPPVKESSVLKVIQRQAQQQRIFPGEAAWTSQMCMSGKGAQQAIM